MIEMEKKIFYWNQIMPHNLFVCLLLELKLIDTNFHGTYSTIVKINQVCLLIHLEQNERRN